MENLKSRIKNEMITTISTEQRKGIENHRKAATHLKKAAKSHLEAAAHHEAGNHDKAAQSTISAFGHVNLANKVQQEDVEQHAIHG